MSLLKVRRDGDRLEVRDVSRLNPKQTEFRDAAHGRGVKEALFHGSIGSGKTQICCKMIVAWAMKFPGSTYLVSRATQRELEDTTKKAMLRGDGGLPPALPPTLVKKEYAFGGLNKVILINGSEILFRSLEPDERGKVRNLTLAGFFIDQAEELDDNDEADGDEAFIDELTGRLRDPNGPRRGLYAANPGPEDHWLVRRFGILPDFAPKGPHPRTVHVHATLMDNAAYLPQDYVAQQLGYRETRPDHYRRMILGQWGAFGGKRFKTFDRRVHVVDPFDVPDEWEILAGMDWGQANPTVYLSIAIDFSGRWWVVAEYYKADETVSAHSTQIKLVEANHDRLMGFHGKLAPGVRWLDPSAWNKTRKEHMSIADEFMEPTNGLYVARAQNERLGGWNRIEEYLTTLLPDGLPQLQIFSTCHNLIRELPNLKIKPGTDDVDKVNDHAPDALRYAAMSRPQKPLERKTLPGDHDRASVARRMLDRVKRPREVEEIN